MKAQDTPAQTAAQSVSETVTLDFPLKRGEQIITTITVTKPMSGSLRGASLTELLQMDVATLTRVLPRVTSPTLTEQDVARLDPADLLQLGTAVSGFLLPKAMKQEASPSA